MYHVLSRARWTQPGLVRTEQQLLPYFPIFLAENHIEQQQKKKKRGKITNNFFNETSTWNRTTL